MSGKFAVALLVLFCVGQVYPASLPKSVAVPVNENLNRDAAINEIIHQLNILISRIGQGTSELGYLIGELERRVAVTIAKVNLPEIVSDIHKQVENIIQEAEVTTDEAVDCINEARASVLKLQKTVNSGVRQCLEPIKPARKHLQEEISEITSQGTEIISYISTGVSSCLKENPTQSLQCLKDFEKPATSLTNDFTGRIGEAIGGNKNLINKLVEELTVCVQAVNEEANDLQKVIINNFRQCVSDIGSTTN